MLKRTRKFLATTISLCLFITSIPITTINAQNANLDTRVSTNVIVNSSFEEVDSTGITGWEPVIADIDRDSVNFDDTGAALFWGTADESDLNLSQNVTVKAGDTNKFSGELQITSGNPSPYLTVTYYDADGEVVEVGNSECVSVDCSTATTTRTKFTSNEYIVPATAVSATIAVGMKGSGKCLWDNVQLLAAEQITDTAINEALKNGSFETLVNDLPENWIVNGSNVSGDEVVMQSNNKVLMLSNGGTSTNPYAQQNIAFSEPLQVETDYIIEAKLKTMTNASKPIVQIEAYDSASTRLGSADINECSLGSENNNAALGEWTTVSFTFKAPTNTKQLKLYLKLQVDSTVDTTSKCYWDDIKVYLASDTAKTNLVSTNSDFENSSSGWTLKPGTATDDIRSVVDTVSDDATDVTDQYAVLISGTTENSDVSVISEKVRALAGSSISFSSKLQVYKDINTVNPYVAITYYDAGGNRIDTNGTDSVDCSGKAIGEWVTINNDNLIAPVNSVSATIAVGQKGIGSCLWDNITFTVAGSNVDTFKNQLKNSEFTTDLTDWNVTIADIKQDGIIALEDDIEYMLHRDTDTQSNPSVQQDVSGNNVVGSSVSDNGDGTYTITEKVTYTVKAKLKVTSDTAKPLIDIYWNGKDKVGDSKVDAKTGFKYRQNLSYQANTTNNSAGVGEWNEVTFIYEAPADVEYLRLYLRIQEEGTCYWDDVRLFRTDDPTQTNLLTNGDFNTLEDNYPTAWKNSSTKHTLNKHYGICRTYGIVDGIKAAAFTGTQNESDVALKQTVNVTAGDDFKFLGKVQVIEEGANPYLTISYQDASGNPITDAIKTIDCSTVGTGTWSTVSTDKMIIPENAATATITVGQKGAGKCLWDALEFRPFITSENKLINGTFETLNISGYPVAWAAYSNVKYGTNTFVEELQTGEKALKFVNANNSSMKVRQLIGNDVKSEQIYTFTAKIKIIENKGSVTTGDNIKALLDIYYLNGSLEQLERDPIYFTNMLDVTNTTDWQEVRVTFTTPADTTTIDLSIACQGKGSCLWKDAALVEGDVFSDGISISDVEKASIEFRNMLKTEANNATVEVGDERGELNVYDPAYPGQSNLIVNGDFEVNSGAGTNILEGWNLKEAFSEYGTIAVDEGDEGVGDDCIKFVIPQDAGLQNPYYDQWVEVVGGAEYQLTYKYKLEGSSARPTIKVEFWTDPSLPGAKGLGSSNVREDPKADGEWHTYSQKFYPASNTEHVWVLARSLARSVNTDNTVLYIDDLELIMTQPPCPLELTTDSIFYYSDVAEKEGATGTISTDINADYYPEFANGRIEIKIRDLNNPNSEPIWSTSYDSTNGEGSASFELSLLQVKEQPYEVSATLYNSDGTVKQTVVQNVYVTDRPTCLDADGVYKKYDAETGTATEVFYPEYAYKVDIDKTDRYQKMKETGINLVQMGAFTTPAAAIERLDAAQEAGIMGFICLYNNMKPAGNDSNIENTIAIIEAVKDHPALFGYAVMDEVFFVLTDPEDDMEASYRLIRSLDPNHPIMTMEASSSHYKDTEKYVDILCIDPYAKARTQTAGGSTALAVEAVNNQKPVYALLEAYHSTSGEYPTPNDLRNNIWQALIKGASCVGYFSISRSKLDPTTGDWTVPIYDPQGDNGALWQAIIDFNKYEKQLAYDHFVFDKTPIYHESAEVGADYWYSSWKNGNDMYMVVLSMLKDAEATQQVSIPLSKEGDESYGRFNAVALSGRIDENGIGEVEYGKDTLNLTLKGWEAVLYKINCAEEVFIVEEQTDTSYTLDSSEEVSITSTGDFSKFRSVEMDGTIVDESNYTVKEGSTIVTFKTEYLETLSVGEHTVTINYTDGGSVDSKLTILAKINDSDTDTDTDSDSNTDTDSDSNTDTDSDTDTEADNKEEHSNDVDSSAEASGTDVTAASGTNTGDSSNMTLWIALIIVSMLGAAAMFVIKKKKN